MRGVVYINSLISLQIKPEGVECRRIQAGLPEQVVSELSWYVLLFFYSFKGLIFTPCFMIYVSVSRFHSIFFFPTK